MSLKTLTNKVTAKVGRQVLTAQKHSPVMLFGIGIIGVGTTAVLACRATLKMSEILQEGEELLQKVEETTEDVKEDNEAKGKAKFAVKFQVAIKVAKLYAPAIAVGVVSVGALTGSHVILHRRNAGLAAAYAIADKSFKDYRNRVIEEHGAEKDLEYRFGTTEREIVEEGPNGPETRILKGVDQDALKNNTEWTYARVYDETNDNWSNIPLQNQFRITMVQNQANDMLRLNKVVFLNDVYDMLGFSRTSAGQQVGWVKGVRKDKDGNDINDGYIDFGIWSEGVYKGKEWVTGSPDAFLLDFNVDGVVLDMLSEV